jgi:hypothetical protein
MRRLTYLLLPVLAALALIMAAPAAADAPTNVTSTVTFGPIVDNESCSFPLTATVERTRTTLTFADGDIKRHTELVVTVTANGKTLIERDDYNVFIDSDSPDLWVITGSFTHARLHDDGTIVLQSGRIVYDPETDTITDLHPGPHPSRVEDVVCDALAASPSGPRQSSGAPRPASRAPSTRLPRRDRDELATARPWFTRDCAHTPTPGACVFGRERRLRPMGLHADLGWEPVPAAVSKVEQRRNRCRESCGDSCH